MSERLIPLVRGRPHIKDVRPSSVMVECWRCSHRKEIAVTHEQLSLWLSSRALIQEAMPELTDAQRELLMSGTCNQCFHKLFGEDSPEYVCPICRSTGFEPSTKGVGCTFCDGTEGGARS